MVDPSDPLEKKKAANQQAKAADKPGNQGAPRPHRTPSVLHAGLLAVQKKQYREAIALLQGIAQGKWDTEIQAKAQVGLVKAYAGLGRFDEAIALCEQLTAVPIPSVYQWANQKLRELQQSARQTGPTAAASSPQEPDLAAGLTLRRSSTTPPSPAPAPPAPATRPPTAPPKSAPPSPGRPPQRSSLGRMDMARLWALEALTLGGVAFLLLALLRLVQTGYNAIANNALLNRIAISGFSLRALAIYGDPRWIIVPLVAIALLASYWILRLQLTWTQGLKPLSLDTLKHHSPEAVRILQTFNRHHRSLAPALAQLPNPAPIALTYGGLWPRQAHLVFSQALLEQLSDDEIAALVAAELAHLQCWDAVVLSAITTLAQLPFFLYWKAAQIGDHQRHILLKTVMVVVSVVSYGLFWSIRLMGLWLSRLRLFYSDRLAVEMTGNPNALSRALLKLAIATAHEVETQGQTPAFLEQFDLLLPVGVRASLTLGSLYPQQPSLELLAWDYRQPFRRWLAIRDSHPPLGDRLYTLARYAQRWRIPSELEFLTPTRPPRPSRTEWWRMGLQSLPALGAMLGLVIGQGLWWFGLLADKVGWLSLDWFRSSFIHSVSILIGFSVGTFLRINPFFPEIKRPNQMPLSHLPDLLTRPEALPANATAVRVQGTLLGRRGIANAIGQDLLLKTDAGLIPLHFLPILSFQQNPIRGWRQLQRFLQQPVIVTGWFRRGVTPWIDLEVLQSQSSKPLRSGHPLWSTVLALGLVVWSCYTIVSGDL